MANSPFPQVPAAHPALEQAQQQTRPGNWVDRAVQQLRQPNLGADDVRGILAAAAGLSPFPQADQGPGKPKSSGRKRGGRAAQISMKALTPQSPDIPGRVPLAEQQQPQKAVPLPKPPQADPGILV